MDVEELEELCTGLRARTTEVDKALVALIEADAEEYRRLRDELVTATPPDAVRERLWLFGWLVYEASWILTNQVKSGFEGLEAGDQRASSVAAADLVTRIHEAAAILGWPELAPRALGAVRSAALVASKRDTVRGYEDAWELHRQGRFKYETYSENLAGEDPRYLLALQETQLQLLLAETGTACRTAERILIEWAEDVESGLREPQEERQWLGDLFRQLATGAARGEEALALVSRIDDRDGLVDSVDAHRLAMATAYRNPGIMTARALLLLLPITFMLERQRRLPPDGSTSWAEARTQFLHRFDAAYGAIATVGRGEPVALLPDHARSVVQLRLNLALLAPGRSLPGGPRFAPCLEIDPLGSEAVTALSSWLAETDDRGRQRGNANIIGSVSMPGYLREIREIRRAFGSEGGYADWRRRWSALDRHADRTGRSDRVEGALAGVDDL